MVYTNYITDWRKDVYNIPYAYCWRLYFCSAWKVVLGGGYLIVQQLLENLSKGRSFCALMADLVINPLNMSRTTYCQDVSRDEIALPYISGQKLYPGGVHQFIEQAVGGMWSTPKDLSKFMIAIQKALHEKETPIPSKTVAKNLINPTITPHRALGFEVQLDKYGQKIIGGTYFLHGGFNPGYLAFFLADTVSSNGVVVMVNISPEMGINDVPEWEFLKSIARKIADDEGWR